MWRVRREKMRAYHDDIRFYSLIGVVHFFSFVLVSFWC